MNDLIKALQIFATYLKEDVYAPTHCEHDKMTIVCVQYDDVSPEDLETLEQLGFSIDGESGGFYSYRFGSC